MADYPGSNDEKAMEGNEKQVYADNKKRFSKLKKLIKTCK